MLKERRTAILGAGIAGTSAALELARRGYAVDLYDENPLPLSRASYNNEGKIHLGLVYARDTSLKTGRTMILGAVHFTAYLNRWIDMQPSDLPVSTAYTYAVHEGTMVSPDELQTYYDRCKQVFAETCASAGLAYLGTDRTLLAERLSAAETANLVSSDHSVAAFRTSERALDPRIIADRLRDAVAASPRIRFIASAVVDDVAWVDDDDSLRVTFRHGGQEHAETYDHVANALWQGRLKIDARLGLAPDHAWIYRYKLGGWLPCPANPSTIPSLTFVLGPFGDVVNFGRRGLYVSWYPAGLVGSSLEVTPPDWEESLAGADRQRVLRQSYDELVKRCPALGGLDYVEDRTRPAGGVIFAWGQTDIQHAESRLHTRHEIGIHSVRNYHSVNTGKYTMGPYLGYKTAERILGLS